MQHRIVGRVGLVSVIVIGLAAGQAALAATWDGQGGANKNWSAATNWSDDADPAGKAITFNETKATNSATPVTSIVDTDYAVSSLTVATTANPYHRVQINSGSTLSVTGAVTIGANTFGLTTVAGFIGGGTLNISNAASTFKIEDAAWNYYGNGIMDASGLANLNMDVANLKVENNQNASGGNQNTLTLATNNTLVVRTGLTVSTSGCTANGTLNMGLTNTIWAASMTIAQGAGHTATMKFLNGGANSVVTIRGVSGGSSRVGTVTIGDSTYNQSSTVGTLDFGTGTVDAMLNNVVIGYSTIPANGGGIMNLNSGTVDATSIMLGQGWQGPGYGLINLGGGVLRATTITMGHNQQNGDNGKGVINLRDGTLQAVTVTNGTGSATRQIIWSGGTIGNYPGSNMSVHSTICIQLASNLTHTFDVESGKVMTINTVISNVAAGANGVVKTNDGTLLLNMANLYTGVTTVAQGVLGGTGSVTGDVNVLNGGTLAPGAANAVGSFGVTGCVTLTGTYAVDMNGASSDLLTVGSNLTLSGATLSVAVTGNPAVTSTVVRYSGVLSGTFASAPAAWTVLYGSGTNDAIRLVSMKPVVDNLPPTNVLATSACMNGFLSTTGASPTYVTLYWGTNDAVTGAWQYTNAFAEAQPVGSLTTNITGLTAATVYYYRYYATNAAGDRWASTTKSFATGNGAVSAVTWDGGSGAADITWTGPLNWNPDINPFGKAVTFGNTAAVAAQATTTSVVDADYTIPSLTFNNYGNSANYHKALIGAGVTLSVTGNVTLGNGVGFSAYTVAGLTGGGTLRVTNTTTFTVGPGTDYGGSTLDASGLANIDLSAVTVKIAGPAGGDADQGFVNTFALAATNRLVVSGTLGVSTKRVGLLQMGAVNTIWAANILAGAPGTGTMNFRNNGTNATVTIRAANGTSRVTLVDVGHTGTGLLDFGAGYVDALFNDLYLSDWGGSGTLNLSTGVVDTANLYMGNGQFSGGTGILNLNGGVVRAWLVQMGFLASPEAYTPSCSAVINLNGGTLQAMTLTNGVNWNTGLPPTATRNIVWSGGTIANYPGTNMVVASTISIQLASNLTHAFSVESGRVMTVNTVISNVAAGASGITKTNAGTLLLNTMNTFTGTTTVVGGALGGAGALAGDLNVLTNGTIAPGPVTGNGIGVFGVTGSVSIAGTYAMQLNISTATPTNDVLNIGSNLTLSAGSVLTLSVTGSNAKPPYTVIRYGGARSGRFSAMQGLPGFSIHYDDANRIIQITRPDGAIFLMR